MSKQRDKGTRVENHAVTVFSRWFPYCERRALRGRNDAGDLTGLPVVCEVKAGVRYIAEALAEAKKAAAKAGIPGRYCAYLDAKGKPPDEDYVVFPAAFGAELLAAWDTRRQEVA